VFIDASKYAAISRFVDQTGDLFHLKIMDEPYLQKPPLHFWLSGLSFHFFGLSNFTYKLPGFLFFFVGLYSIYRLGILYYNRTTGWTAMFIMGFSQAMFLYLNDMHTDTLLTMLVTFSIWQLAEYIESGRRVNYILGFLAAGLGLITKGPVGLLVPAFAIVGHLFMKRDWVLLFHPKWIPGIMLVGLILFPVLKGQYDMFGAEGIRFFFWTNNAGRITGAYAGNNRDYFFYLHTLLYLFLPWSVQVILACCNEVIQWRRNGFRFAGNREYIAWSGILVFVGVLSIARMKSPHYILPILPLVALVTAKWTVRYDKEPEYRKWMNFSLHSQTGIAIILLTLAVLVPAVFSPSKNLLVWAFMVFNIGFFVYLVLFFKKNLLQRLLLISAVSITTLNFAINSVFLPEMNRYNSGARASERYNQLTTENDVLYLYQYSSHEPPFYANGRVLALPENLKKDILRKGGFWLFTTQAGLDTLKTMDIAYQVTDTFPHLSLSRINSRSLFPNTRKETAGSHYLLKIN
jgi:4-amino-4-deoxy-L-arabinose transferase-like glycosyltransferase